MLLEAPAAAAGCAPAPPPPGGPRGLQPAGGGALRPGRGDGLPCSLRHLDSAALRMLLVDANRPEPVRGGARELALFLTPEPGAEAKAVEETVEVMLLRLEEFCSLTDLIRSDTSQILEEHIPVLKSKVTEMRGIYAKVDQLEAFVKMVGHHVSFLEAHVLQAERDHGAFLQVLRRWLGPTGLPSFKNQGPSGVRLHMPGPVPSHLYQTWGPPRTACGDLFQEMHPSRGNRPPQHPRRTSCPRCTGPRTIFLWTLGKRRSKPPAAIGICEPCGPATGTSLGSERFAEAVGAHVWQSLGGDPEEAFPTSVRPAWCSRMRRSRLRSHLARSLGTQISLFQCEGLCAEIVGLT
ncbi:Breast Carcinoma-Amplified Sequence 4 [Manis pentadactyla]|nr:Breast Carcinoma-Amplified Sequence 4 [Manis pentadactyla]